MSVRWTNPLNVANITKNIQLRKKLRKYIDNVLFFEYLSIILL